MWEATNPEDNVFAYMPMAQIKSMLGAKIGDYSNKIKQASVTDEEVPEIFDSREEWKDCIHPIRDQGKCGSCWAFGATEVLSDRICIATEGKTDVVISPQNLVDCSKDNYGCQGGSLDKAWEFLEASGSVSDTCYEYKGVDGTCQVSCSNDEEWIPYHATNIREFGSIEKQSSRVKAMQQEIQKNGPIETTFQVYSDFLNYKSGVYVHNAGEKLGGHAVEIVGWGAEEGRWGYITYWIAANSWGSKWGEAGHFRIYRGDDEVQFESGAIVGDFKL